MITNKYEKYIKDFELHCLAIEKSTTVNINESLNDKDKRINRLKKSYVKWYEYYFPHYAKSQCAPYHKDIADTIIKNTVSYTIFEAYRGAAKSVHICMGIPLFLMITNQLKFMLLVGETQPKADLLLSDIQAELEHNQRFINDYGKKFNHGNWADGEFATRDGIYFKSISINQSPRGARNHADRPDYIVVDDVDNKERCNNDRRIREAVEWIMEDLWGAFDIGRERFVLGNNRIHKNSILANMAREFHAAIQAYKEEGKKPEHFVFKVNAVVNEITYEPTWTAKYTAEYWRNKFRSRPRRSVQREYMNNPQEEGKIFKADDLQWRKILPYKDYDSIVCYGDLSYKDKGDFKAMEIWGKKGRELHCINVFLRQNSRRHVAMWLYNLYENEKLNQENIRYLIEGLFAQDDFVNDFDTEGDKRGFHIPVVADNRGKANKFDRIESLAGYFERHEVFFNIEEKNNRDQIELIDQFLAFEKGSNANDDGPDAAHGAIAELNKRTFVEQFIPRIFKRTSKSY